MDLEAVRTFVAVSDAGQFSEAAAELSITQQAVSKRIAALEKDLGVWLFTRTARGAELTVDGQAFLPHARELRIAVRDPTPVYPHSLIWRNDNPHPALATLRDYLAAIRPRQGGNGIWAPGWARD